MPNTFTDVPIASHTLAADQDPMRQNFNYIPGALGKDHQVVLGDSDTGTTFEGRHTQVCFNNRHAAPPTVAGVGDGTNAILYADNGNVFFGSGNGAGVFQLTNFDGTGVSNFGVNTTYQASVPNTIAQCTGGWTFLPGGLILNYGSATTLKPGGSITVKFAKAFPGNVFNVVCTPRTSTSIGGGTHDWDVGTVINASFALAINGNYVGTDTFYFFAVGN